MACHLRIDTTQLMRLTSGALTEDQVQAYVVPLTEGRLIHVQKAQVLPFAPLAEGRVFMVGAGWVDDHEPGLGGEEGEQGVRLRIRHLCHRPYHQQLPQHTAWLPRS